jgi:hypothetical protein
VHTSCTERLPTSSQSEPHVETDLCITLPSMSMVSAEYQSLLEKNVIIAAASDSLLSKFFAVPLPLLLLHFATPFLQSVYHNFVSL